MSGELRSVRVTSGSLDCRAAWAVPLAWAPHTGAEIPMVAALLAAVYALAPIAGPAQGGSIVTLPLPAGCAATACHFGTAGSAPATVVRGNVVCTAPPALQTGAATSLLEGVALNTSVFYGSAQLHGDLVHLTRPGAQDVGTPGSASFENIGTLVVPPPLTNSLASAALRLSFELLVGRGTGGEGFSVSFAAVPRGMQVDERGVADSLAISFAR